MINGDKYAKMKNPLTFSVFLTIFSKPRTVTFFFKPEKSSVKKKFAKFLKCSTHKWWIKVVVSTVTNKRDPDFVNNLVISCLVISTFTLFFWILKMVSVCGLLKNSTKTEKVMWIFNFYTFFLVLIIWKTLRSVLEVNINRFGLN